MPAHSRGLFSPAPGAPRSVSRAQHDYISPATRRQKGVAPSPALTTALWDTGGATTLMGESTMNDDEAERKERRRSRVLELQRRNLDSPAAQADRRLSEPLSGLSNVQLTEHYTNCIKLSAENKINAKNAFGLHLIDYMSELLKKKEMNNFQVASSTLDASAKIYAGRVDAVHSETYKVLSGLGRGAERTQVQTGEEGEEGEGPAEAAAEAGEVKEKKRKRARKSNTIETNLKNINVNKFDLEFEVDPLFSKTSAAFDEGGTSGLLLNHLRCLDDTSELVLDSNTIVTGIDTLSDSQQARMSRPVDLSEFRALYSGVNLEATEICPAFADFEFMNWNRDGDDVFSRLNASQCDSQAPSTQPGTDVTHDAHAFDMEAEVEPVPGDSTLAGMGDGEGGGGGAFMDDFGCEDEDDAGSVGPSDADKSERDFCMGDGQAAKIFNKAMDDIKHGTVGTLMQVLAQEPSDYSYFKTNLLRTWAGPGHWKPAPRTKGFTSSISGSDFDNRAKKSKDKKNDIFNLNYREETEFDSLFKESRASTTLTKATLDKYSKTQTTLPEDLHYDADKLFKLFEKPKLMIKRYTSREDGEDEACVDNYDYDNDNDRENFCPNSQEDDEDNEGGFELTNISDNVFTQDTTQAMNMTGLDGTLMGDKLLSQPRKVAKIDIAYAKAAKKVDVKKVKAGMWSLLTKPAPQAEKPSTADIEAGDKSGEGEPVAMETSDAPGTSADQSAHSTSADQSADGVAGQHSFQQLLTSLPAQVSRSQARNLSVPIAFVCLLHLANEKTLEITSDDTMADLRIKQG